MSMTFREITIPAKNVRSLAWDRDGLVDWAAGGVLYGLDGTAQSPRVFYAFPFDAVATLSGSEFCVIYRRLGTKALLLRNGDIVRELDRSYYCAASFEYPVCLLARDGRTLLIHCPEHYNQLEIEDAATGERLTARSSKPEDFFHSRLQPSPDGKRVLSAGWIWHPVDAVGYFDVAEALEKPDALNQTLRPLASTLVEQSSAAWLNDHIIVLCGGEEELDPEELSRPSDAPRLGVHGIASFDVLTGSILSSCFLGEPAGTIMAWGPDHVVSFHAHPKLVRLGAGAIEKTWPHISSGRQTSSILLSEELPPPIALDPAGGRFAVAAKDAIHVVLAN